MRESLHLFSTKPVQGLSGGGIVVTVIAQLIFENGKVSLVSECLQRTLGGGILEKGMSLAVEFARENILRLDWMGDRFRANHLGCDAHCHHIM